MDKKEVKIYRPTISPEAREPLAELAASLGFFVSQKGRHIDNPSPPQMVESLAAAYRADPTVVAAALRGLGVVGEAEPQAE